MHIFTALDQIVTPIKVNVNPITNINFKVEMNWKREDLLYFKKHLEMQILAKHTKRNKIVTLIS